jgi:hypothetical protein
VQVVALSNALTTILQWINRIKHRKSNKFKTPATQSLLYVFIPLNDNWWDGFLLPAAQETEVAAYAKEFLKLCLVSTSQFSSGRHVGTGIISCTIVCFVCTKLVFVIRTASVIMVVFQTRSFRVSIIYRKTKPAYSSALSYIHISPLFTEVTYFPEM